MKHMNRAVLFPPRCYVSRKPFVNGYRAESRYYFLYATGSTKATRV